MNLTFKDGITKWRERTLPYYKVKACSEGPLNVFYLVIRKEF